MFMLGIFLSCSRDIQMKHHSMHATLQKTTTTAMIELWKEELMAHIQTTQALTFDAGAKADAEATSANTTATVFIILFCYFLLIYIYTISFWMVR